MKKKSHLYALIQNYTITNFQQHVPPIRLFFFVGKINFQDLLSHKIIVFAWNSIEFLIRIPSRWFPISPIRISHGDTQMEIKSFMVPSWMLPKLSPILLFRPIRLLISFQEIFPPILLFSPIFLLVFQKISHLYFYSESLFIRNSRVRLKRRQPLQSHWTEQQN